MYTRHRESGVNDDSSWHKGQSYRRKRLIKIAIAAIVFLIVLAVALGAGLGIGLRKSDNNRPHVKPVNFPTDGLDLSSRSLQTRGYFYTSPEDSSSAPIFNWTSGGFTFKTYSNDTTKADIIVNTSLPIQQIDGFGAALTDSAAYTFFQLKQSNMTIYNQTLNSLFNIRTGIPILRIPLGSSDFSLQEYVFAPNAPPGDILAQAIASPKNITNALQSAGFGLGVANDYLIPVLRDIIAIRPQLKVMFSPWSPPAWTKTGGSLSGGSIIPSFVPLVAQYYVMSIKAFVDAGIPAWSMTLQNEPGFAAKYPSTIVDSPTQSQLASTIRALLPAYNLSNMKIFAHDHNFALWQDAADIVNLNSSAIDGIAWHAYKGDASQISQFRANITTLSLETHMTEFTGTTSDSKTRWDSQKYWLESVYFPMLNQYARSVEIWNIALDPKNGPRLKSAYCSNCVGGLQISTPDHFADPWVQVQAQYLTMAHFDAAAVDLSTVGGGPAYRALTIQQPNSVTNSSSNMTCITSQGFAAALKGDKLGPSNAMTTDTVFSRRVGLVLYNSCGDAQNLALNIDGRATTFNTRPGLTSLVWVAP
ncbi:hypothetical protein A4X13_0g5383 [Tilletia indica]|uniref:Glycosyl hydrolase family 30 TIM-barrel domain-containing protein n=1 Tax=Tilletia indica TaxID=43049 RepID=A0A177TTI8_9BASI|nr:hypothetical protein A4X13_0g5383 [Tilletia indica]